MDETSNTGTISMGEQISCALHIDTKEFVAMSAAIEAFSKVSSRVKQYVDAMQVSSKAEILLLCIGRPATPVLESNTSISSR